MALTFNSNKKSSERGSIVKQKTSFASIMKHYITMM